MTTTHAAQRDTTPRTPHQVNDRVQVHRRGTRRLGRISSVHHHDNGIEYVVRLDGPDGGLGAVVNVWTTSGHSTFLTPTGGEQR
ncbi:hypothetical protein [uncultured Jatrophihabitans sp.]|uniref:hypothetical protein n=1 Tax=uncultured Jatrophihabitans sp. TaxID=1610747 RepID=UPI0035CB834F